MTTVDAVLGAARAEAAARSLALLPPTRSVARWIAEEERSIRKTSVSPKARPSWAPVTVVVQRRRGLSAVVLHGSRTERR